MPGTWLLKRTLTGQTLATEAPLTVVDEPTRTLNGSGRATLKCTATFAELRSDVDGLPMVLEWDTSVYLIDANGDVAFGGFIVTTKDSPDEYTLEVATPSAYLSGLPYLGPEQYLAKTDPADIVRLLVDWAQDQPDADVGLQVTGSTPIRLGSTSTLEARAASDKYDDAKADYDAVNKVLKGRRDDVAAERKQYSALVATRTAASRALTAAKAVRPKNPTLVAQKQTAYNNAVNAAKAQAAVVANYAKRVDDQEKVVETARKLKDSTYAAKQKADDKERDDGGAYMLLWWEAPDAMRQLQSLADDNAFDWQDTWSRRGDTITSTIRIDYPRAGRRRDDVVFEEGLNVLEVIEATTDGDAYASEVVGIGAGEGAKSIRRSTAIRNGRVKRTKVITDKDVKSRDAMDRRVNRELRAAQRTLEVQRLLVRKSPQTQWDIGDDVRVKVNLAGHGEVDLYHRVLDQQDIDDDQALLTLQRSDSFIYGG